MILQIPPSSPSHQSRIHKMIVEFKAGLFDHHNEIYTIAANSLSVLDNVDIPTSVRNLSIYTEVPDDADDDDHEHLTIYFPNAFLQNQTQIEQGAKQVQPKHTADFQENGNDYVHDLYTNRLLPKPAQYHDMCRKAWKINKHDHDPLDLYIFTQSGDIDIWLEDLLVLIHKNENGQWEPLTVTPPTRPPDHPTIRIS